MEQITLEKANLIIQNSIKKARDGRNRLKGVSRNLYFTSDSF